MYMYVYLRVRCIQARYGFRIIVNVKFHVFFFSLFLFLSFEQRGSHVLFFFNLFHRILIYDINFLES